MQFPLEVEMVLTKLRLWWLEQRLGLHLGKYNAYLNRVYEQRAHSDLSRRLSIARQLLREPELEFGQRMLEAARLKNRLTPIRVEKQTADKPSDENNDTSDVRPMETG